MQCRRPPLHLHLSLRTHVKDLLVLALGYGCALSLLALDITLPAAGQPAGQPPRNASVTVGAGGNDRGRATAVHDRCAARADAPVPAPAIDR